MNTKLKESNENTEYYCPTGYIFLTNVSYGKHQWIPFGSNEFQIEDNTQYYQEFIAILRNAGYLVQVAEPFDIYNHSTNRPLYPTLAIYIKKETGETRIGEAWNAIDKARGR